MTSKPDALAQIVRTAVVTGAGSGVGQAVAVGLALLGIQVALVGRTRAKLLAVVKKIRAEGGTTRVFPCDVANIAHVQNLHDQVSKHFGTAQILINAAGLHSELVPIRETTPEKWILTLQTNMVGPYLICRAFLPDMLHTGWGRIINISSAASTAQPAHIGAVYQLSKVSLNWFTRQLASELAGTGITANAIHPGEVKTEMWAAIKEDASSRNGIGRDALQWVELVEKTGGDPPEKTTDLIKELLGPESDDINGQFLWIAGGIRQPRPTW